MSCRRVYFLLIVCSYFFVDMPYKAFCHIPFEGGRSNSEFGSEFRESVEDKYYLKSDYSKDSSRAYPDASCILINKPYWADKPSTVPEGLKMMIDITKDGFGNCYTQVPMRNVSDEPSFFPCYGVLVHDLVMGGKCVPAGSKLYMHSSGGLDAARLIQKGSLLKDTWWNKISSFYWMRQKISFLCLRSLGLCKGFIFFLGRSVAKLCIALKKGCFATYKAANDYLNFCNQAMEKRKSKTKSKKVD